MDRRHASVADCVERLRSSDPDCAVARGRYRINFLRPQSFAIRYGHHPTVVKGIEAAGGDDPECAFAILEKPRDVISREPVHTTKLLDGFSMDAIDALIDRAHPQAACAIVVKRRHRQSAAI